MAGLHDYTTKEVLNKVLLDSSGDAVAAFSHTTQEALNAVLDTANSRLNVSLVGGTISGDVTINGDLTVNGDGSGNYDEIVNGNLQVGSAARSATILEAQSDATKPSFAFTGDTNTGMGSASANQINFITDGGTRMYIDAYGQVSIGAAPGNGKLAVTNTASNNPNIFLDHNSSATTTVSNRSMYIDFDKTGNTASGQTIAMSGLQIDMNNDSATDVGTTNLTGLDVNMTMGTSGTQAAVGLDINVSGADTNTALKVQVPAGYGSYNILQISDDTDTGISYNTANSISISAGANETRFHGSYVQFNSNGGSTSARIVHEQASATNPVYTFNGAQTYGIGSSAGDVLNLITNSLSRMTINAAGLVGINTASPDAPLHIKSQNTGWDGAIVLEENDDGTANMIVRNEDNLWFGYAPSAADVTASPVMLMVINESGNVGIGTSSPDSLMEIESSATSGHTLSMKNTSVHSNVNLKLDFNGNDGATQASKGYLLWSNTTNQIHLNSHLGLRFQISETTRFLLDANSRMSLSNSDNNTSNTVFGKSAFNQGGDVGADYNVAIGELAMGTGTLAATTMNVAIGYGAFTDATTGDYNVIIGHLSGTNLSTGSNNIIIGREAMQTSTTAENCIVIGNQALQTVNHGSNDGSIAIGKLALSAKNLASGAQFTGATTAIGYKSLEALTSGLGNTAIGYEALKTAATEAQSVAIGYQSMAIAANSSNNVMVGYKTGYDLYQGSDNNTGIGHNALSGTHAAGASEKNTAIGSGSMVGAIAGAAHNTAVGYNTLAAVTSGDNNIGIGNNAGAAITTTSQNILMGKNAGVVVTSNNNVSIGYNSMLNITTGDKNVAVGSFAMATNHDGNSRESKESVFVGYNSGGGTWANNQSHYNTAVGAWTMDAALDGALYNTALGIHALAELTQGDANVAIGAYAGSLTTEGVSNVAIGAYDGTLVAALRTNTVGSFNIAIGTAALAVVNENDNDGSIAIGHKAGYRKAGTGGDQFSKVDVLIGYATGSQLTTGGSNVAVGHSAMGGDASGTALTGSNNVVIGNSAGYDMEGSSSSNTIIGSSAGIAVTDASNLVLLGKEAGAAITSTGASGTIAIGQSAGKRHTSGSGCVYIGNAAADHCTDGHRNVAIGESALSGNADDDNVAIGYGALSACTGADNVAIGKDAGNVIQTGSENTLVGYNVDVASEDNTNNVVLGNNLTATDKDNAVFIGNDTNHIENDFNADATWNYSSDVRQKKDIKDDTLGLDFINDLRPVTYKHKSPSEFPKEWSAYDANDKEPMGGDKTIHGLIAQEVKQALDNQGVDTFGGWSVGDDGRQRISAEKMVMPLIKAVQELSARVKELESK